jgi:hypothetical protein
MKRRDFVKGATGAVVADLALQIEAAAQGVSTSPLQPTRTTRLVDPSFTAEQTACYDVIYDGSQLLCLYSTRDGALNNGPTYLASSKLSGDMDWHYLLPPGNHVSIGTYHGHVLVAEVPRVVWALDPRTGSTEKIKTSHKAPLFYAGDSIFFSASNGNGEIWKFDGGLEKIHSSGKAQSYTAKLLLRQLCSSDQFASATADGSFIARLSVTSGAVFETAITGEFISNIRSFYGSANDAWMARNGLDPIRDRVARPIVISSIGAGNSGTIYALVVTPRDPRGVFSLITIDEFGNGTLIAKIQVSDTVAFPFGLLSIGSELGVVCRDGSAKWYPRPV